MTDPGFSAIGMCARQIYFTIPDEWTGDVVRLLAEACKADDKEEIRHFFTALSEALADRAQYERDDLRREELHL
jgi:hypothetical protein